MSTGATPKEFLPLTPDQKEVVSNLTSATKLVAVVLIALGAIYLVSGVYSLIVLDAGVLGAMLTLVQGVLCVIMGLVTLAVTGDFKFLGQFPQYSHNHFRNVTKDLTMFHRLQLGLAVVIALLAIVRTFV